MPLDKEMKIKTVDEQHHGGRRLDELQRDKKRNPLPPPAASTKHYTQSTNNFLVAFLFALLELSIIQVAQEVQPAPLRCQ